MRPLKSLAICMTICAFVFGLMAIPVLAGDDDAWAKKKGRPAEPPIQSVGPSYYGQPLTLDGRPWTEDPPRNGAPGGPIIPTMSPSAWWLQPALDEHSWDEKPPKPGNPNIE